MNCQYGVMCESYRFAIDGEFCSGYKEFDVIVTNYWKTGTLKNQPKEVKTSNEKYYRYTKQNGWRQYDMYSKKYYDKRGTSTMYSFKPNINSDYTKNYNKVNLGSW